jgi:hypothetical protein
MAVDHHRDAALDVLLDRNDRGPGLRQQRRDHHLEIARSGKAPARVHRRPLTRGLREEIGTINEMLRDTDIDVPGAIKLAKNLLMFEELGWDENDRPFVKRHHVRLTHKAGRRIFAGDFEHHGRFYCSAQNIPSDARSTMTINGESCAELDFSAMHPTLAYNIAGGQMDGDPYDLGDAFERRQVKLGLLIVMNARDPASAVRALARHGRQLGINHDKAKAIVNAILKRHDAIRAMLCNDWGIKLMNVDAPSWCR